MIASVTTASRAKASERQQRRRVPPAGDGAAAGDPPREEPRPSRALVPSGPSPSSGPRAAPALSAPFITQLAAADLGDLRTGDRRIDRRPDLILPRARAVYGAARRLSTELEPGFIVVKDL